MSEGIEWREAVSGAPLSPAQLSPSGSSLTLTYSLPLGEDLKNKGIIEAQAWLHMPQMPI